MRSYGLIKATSRRLRPNIKCNSCGRFIAYKELGEHGGSSSAFIPSSEVSYEEQLWHCKKCTKEHGAPIPMQSCNLSVVQSINN